jgi:hypothetical protein
MTDDTHEKLFDLVRDLQKDLSQLEALLKSHLDTSDIRVQNWEKEFESFNQSIECCKAKIEDIMNFKKAMLQNKDFIVSIFSMIGYIMSILVGLGTIYLVFK